MPGVRKTSVAAGAHVAVLFVCLVLGTPPAAAAILSLPGDAGGPQGSSSVAFLTINNAAGILGTDIIITYDPGVITATDVTLTELSSSHVLTHNLSSPGVIRISLYGSQPLSGSGALLAISFTSVGDPGSETPLDLDSADLNEGGILAFLVDGQFCVGGQADEAQDLTATLLPDSITTELQWIPHPSATAYNLYRGTRADLGDLACYLSGIPGTNAVDATPLPSPGDLFVYLVTGVACSGETSPGRDSMGVERFLPIPCP